MSGDPTPVRGRREAVQVSVPGNLLLLGEYAVLEEGGLGLALAPDTRARAVFVPSDAGRACTISGRLRSETMSWPGNAGLLGRVADSMLEAFGPFEGHIDLDTGALYDGDGRKRGLGSSAAMTVALVALWPVAAGYDPLPEERLVDIATRAHRDAQEGRGSGYDIATSALGGCVLFTGGECPRSERVELPWLPPIATVPGPVPVSTTAAVAAYARWKRESPSRTGCSVERSNRLVRRFVSAGSWDEARAVIDEYRELGERLGEAIGVPASMRPPAGALTYKAVGAGNELGVVMPAEPGTAIPIAAEGLRWE